jgi:hypothetical protein
MQQGEILRAENLEAVPCSHSEAGLVLVEAQVAAQSSVVPS